LNGVKPNADVGLRFVLTDTLRESALTHTLNPTYQEVILTCVTE